MFHLRRGPSSPWRQQDPAMSTSQKRVPKPCIPDLIIAGSMIMIMALVPVIVHAISKPQHKPQRPELSPQTHAL